jgi:hypothetical protein
MKVFKYYAHIFYAMVAVLREVKKRNEKEIDNVNIVNNTSSMASAFFFILPPLIYILNR